MSFFLASRVLFSRFTLKCKGKEGQNLCGEHRTKGGNAVDKIFCCTPSGSLTPLVWSGALRILTDTYIIFLGQVTWLSA